VSSINHKTQRQLLDAVRDIALRAGDAIMAIYETGFAVDYKLDASPLTEADRAAHAVIVDALAALTPRLPVLSEESPPEAIANRREWQAYWLVDPLDGTKEFIKRNGEFTVNIALIEATRPILGVVSAPALGVVYAGASELGAWRSSAPGEAQSIAVASAHAGPARVLGSRSHPSAALSEFLANVEPFEIVPMGSSLKICLVADGSADIYPRFGPTSEWDTAAAHAVLESAGGNMIDLQGRKLRYNTKDSLLNPHFLAVGDSSRNWLAAIPK